MRLKAFQKLKPQFLYNRVKNCNQDFPVGTVGRNPPDNVGDMGLTPGPGRFYMLPEQLSPQATTTEPVLHNKRSHSHEKLTHSNKAPPLATTRESPCTGMKIRYNQK